MSGNDNTWHGTTILSVRKNGRVIVAGDGQVTQGQTVMKPNAKKVRRLGDGSVIGGFAGATADAFTLFERLERKLEQHHGQLLRAAVELAKDWRTDKYYRDSPRYQERRLSRDDRVYRGQDGRYYCRRSDGTTGLLVGAAVGGLLGNVIAPGGSKTLGTLLGAAGGGVAGASIDANNTRCR